MERARPQKPRRDDNGDSGVRVRARTTIPDDAPILSGREIPLRDLEDGLRIDEHALEEACLEQPEVFYRVAKELSLAISRRDQQKQHIEELEAEIDAKIRHDAEVAEEKIREADVTSQKLLHPKIRAARTELLRYQTRVGALTALKEAFSQRSYVLKDLTALYLANYYGEVNEGRAGRIRTADSRMARDTMSRERHQRER